MAEFYGKRVVNKLEKGGRCGTLGPFPARKSIAMEPSRQSLEITVRKMAFCGYDSSSSPAHLA